MPFSYADVTKNDIDHTNGNNSSNSTVTATAISSAMNSNYHQHTASLNDSPSKPQQTQQYYTQHQYHNGKPKTLVWQQAKKQNK
jgi:hypothetical protein